MEPNDEGNGLKHADVIANDAILLSDYLNEELDNAGIDDDKGHTAAVAQILATLALAAQVKRIADAFEFITDDDGSLSVYGKGGSFPTE